MSGIKWIHIYQLENMGLPHFTQEFPYLIEISDTSLTHKYNKNIISQKWRKNEIKIILCPMHITLCQISKVLETIIFNNEYIIIHEVYGEMIDKLNKFISNDIPKKYDVIYKNAIEYLYHILSDILLLSKN